MEIAEEVDTVNKYGDGIWWTRGELLGEGGFASVFSATVKYPGSRFPNSVMAVKSAEISRAESLRHEREVLSSLVGCSSIIQCLGEEITNGIDGSAVYNLFLEYGSGGTLADRIIKSGDRGLPELEVRCYTRSMIKGLIKIHKSGYVHCDLKPENILLVPRKQNGGSPEFTAKICDFGLAKRVKEDRQKRKVERTWRGTLMFLPPEAVKTGVQETPCDIWSLGCIVLEMLTGNSAWDVEEGRLSTDENIIRKLLRGVAVPKIPKKLSPEAKSFLRCCLKRMAKNRASAKTLLYHPFVTGLRDEDGFEIGLKSGVGEGPESRFEAMDDWGSEPHDEVPLLQLPLRRNCLGKSSQIRQWNPPNLYFA